MHSMTEMACCRFGTVTNCCADETPINECTQRDVAIPAVTFANDMTMLSVVNGSRRRDSAYNSSVYWITLSESEMSRTPVAGFHSDRKAVI